MVIFGRVEFADGGDLGHDWRTVGLLRIQAVLVFLGEHFLRGVVKEDHGAVLRAHIGPLAVQLRWVVRQEEN